MRRCYPVTVVTAPDLFALADALRRIAPEPESRPWPETRRTYPPTSRTTEGTRMAAPEPLFRADIDRNTREAVRVSLEARQGRFTLDVRVWEDARFGSILSRCPTKRGATIDASKIPEMIAALEGARVEAERLGLLEGDR